MQAPAPSASVPPHAQHLQVGVAAVAAVGQPRRAVQAQQQLCVPALEALYCRGQGLIVDLVLRRSVAASVVAGQRQAPPQLRYQRVAHAGGQHPL